MRVPHRPRERHRTQGQASVTQARGRRLPECPRYGSARQNDCPRTAGRKDALSGPCSQRRHHGHSRGQWQRWPAGSSTSAPCPAPRCGLPPLGSWGHGVSGSWRGYAEGTDRPGLPRLHGGSEGPSFRPGPPPSRADLLSRSRLWSPHRVLTLPPPTPHSTLLPACPGGNSPRHGKDPTNAAQPCGATNEKWGAAWARARPEHLPLAYVFFRAVKEKTPQTAALARVARWLEHLPMVQTAAGSTAVQGHILALQV